MKAPNVKALLFWLAVILWSSGLQAQTQATVTVQESAGGCDLVTDCDNNIICVDIVMTLSQSKTLDSYNIWVEYDGTVISREAFMVNNNTPIGDNSCVIANGAQDTDLEGAPFNPDHWRVSGVPGSGFPMVANVPVVIHTICFIIQNPSLLSGQAVCVGGDVSGLLTTVTFTDGSSDTNVPETCMTLDENFSSCTLLPVALLQFDVTKNGNQSRLDWTTSMEINNDYFEIQRAGPDKVFSTIGRVEGMGNKSSLTTYRYFDKSPFRGINYYRLKQFDWDGRFEFSPVKSLVFDDKWFKVKVKPTIIRAEVFLEIETGYAFSEIKVIDLTGRVVATKKVRREDYVTKLDIGYLSAGTYTILVESGAQTFQERIVIVH